MWRALSRPNLLYLKELTQQLRTLRLSKRTVPQLEKLRLLGPELNFCPCLRKPFHEPYKER